MMSSSPSDVARRRSRSQATASAGDTVATGPSGETSSLFIASTSSDEARRKMPTWLPKKSSAPSRSFVGAVRRALSSQVPFLLPRSSSS